MIRVRARGGVDVRAVVAAVIAVRVRGELAIPAHGTLAVIIHRRIQNLLPETREPHVWQALDLIEPAVDARRGQRIKAPVVPIFVRLDEGTWLRIVRIFARKIIVHHQRVGLVIDERLQIQIRRRRRLPSALENLTVFRNRAELWERVRARVRLLVVQIIILQPDLTPLAEVQIHVRPQAHAALRAIIHVNFSVRIRAEIPVVAGQQEAAISAAIAWREIQVVRVRSEVALVIRKIKYRHALRIQHRIPHLHRFARNDFDARRVHAQIRIRRVIRRHIRVVGVINLVARIAGKIVTAREHRPFARAERFALHLVRLEIIADVVAHPELVARFHAHMAVRHHLARLRVQRRAVRRQRRVAVFHIDAVRACGRAIDRVVIHLALHRAGNNFAQRLHFPRRSFLRGYGKKGKREKNQRDGGKRFHQARPVKQKDTPTAKSLLTTTPLKTDPPSP